MYVVLAGYSNEADQDSYKYDKTEWGIITESTSTVLQTIYP